MTPPPTTTNARRIATIMPTRRRRLIQLKRKRKLAMNLLVERIRVTIGTLRGKILQHRRPRTLRITILPPDRITKDARRPLGKLKVINKIRNSRTRTTGRHLIRPINRLIQRLTINRIPPPRRRINIIRRLLNRTTIQLIRNNDTRDGIHFFPRRNHRRNIGALQVGIDGNQLTFLVTMFIPGNSFGRAGPSSCVQ